MPSKLYPPYIEGSLPAFYLRYDPTKTIVQGADLTIPFSMNDAVGNEQVKAFVLRLRTTSSGSYLFPPVYSTAFALDENKVTFNLTKSQAELLNEGQFYKVQIAYCGKASSIDNNIAIGDDIGYFSTVGIIKCTSQPQIYINNLNANNVNFFSNDFIGVYDQTNCKDQSEKVYSYEFIVYDENEKIYFTTGEKLHQSVYDVNYNQSIDKVSINDFVASGVTYSIQYKVTTMNNLILSSQKYKITNENLVSPNKPIEILPEANEDNGYIKIKFKGELDLIKSWYYVLDEDKIEFETDEIKQEVFNIIKRQINPLAFLKLNTLYKNNELNYIWDRNELSGFKKIRKNNKYYYVKEDAPAQDDIELYNNYYELIATGKELIKNISYKEAKEKYAYINKTEHIYRVNDKKQYLLDISPYEALYYGSYILSRSSNKDNYSTWSVINRFRLDGQRPTSYEVKDITVEHGRKYRYSLQQYNIWGLISSRILSKEVYATFEDMYLYDGDKILKIRYNPKVDSFKINVLEQKTDTLGGQFPYITRNGATWYKQFPIGGLIAQELDTDESFINRNYGLAHRHTTPVIQDKYNTNEELIQKADIPDNALRDFHAFTDGNILLEREFKNAILEWLNDGNAKLFKSPYEGNYIVRLMQNTLSPVNELGRMLHSFTSQAYEIAECNYSNLVKYGFIKTIPPSDYSGLWKTYNLTDKNLINSDGDIEIKFDVGLNTFTVQDMMPGDIIYLLYSDSSEWEPIMIGITGSYTYVGSGRTITKLKIHPQSEISQTSNRNISGTIDCFYQGVRITAFDGIIGQQLITIPSQQYVGVNPFVEKIKKIKWDTTTNNGQYSFSVSDAQYRELQNYNVKDFINDNLSQDSSGTFYKINDNFVRNIATFEPGDILQRINTTLNHGDSYKIDLLNIEQAKFRVREVIPVYVLKSKKNGNENEYEMSHKYNGTYQMVGEQILDDRSISGTCYVSTSPYGYPHRIEELVEFEMLDPYCIFEVFEIGENGNWQPISLTKGRPTQYYDPFYKTWLLYEYDPTFQINYTWKKVIFNPSENDIAAKEDALENKANGEVYNEDLIFDYELKQIDNNNYYYENNLKNKVYIQQKDDAWFTLYEKYNGQYYAYGYHKEPFKNNNEKIYFVKEYETDVNLLTVKEKEYKNLKNINSIKIGNGVMAELTFQIKVIDYYTEIINEDVKKAKEDYLAKKNFYSNLMKQYAIVYKANYVKNKSASLANAYDKLINGTNGSFLSSGDKEIIKNLLLNQYEKSQFNTLSLYNVEFINNKLPSALIEKLQNYKIDNGKLDLTTIQIFQMVSPDDDQPVEDMFFIVNNNNIKCPIIKKSVKDENGNIIEKEIKITNEDEDSIDYYFKSLPQIYRQNNSNDDIIFAVNKNKLIDFYNENYPEEQILFPDNYQILYADIYTKENIKDMIISKKQAYLNDGSSIGRLNKYIFNEKDNLYTAINKNSQYFIGETYYILNEENKYIKEKINLEEENNNKQYYIKNNGLSLKEWYLLTEEEKDAIQELSNFISIEKVEYIEEKTPLPFYEEKELQSLSNENNEEIEGVQPKLEDLNLQIVQINETINNLNDQITEEKNEYINLLTALKEEIEAHNQNVLKNWAYNEIRRLIINGENLEKIKNYLTGSIENIENAKDEIVNTITRYLTSCDRLYDLTMNNLEEIKVYNQIIKDAANNQEDLKEHYNNLIKEKSGNILIYQTAFHNAIFQVASRTMVFNQTEHIFQLLNNNEEYQSYIIQLQTAVSKYLNMVQEINKNSNNETQFIEALNTRLEKMKNEYILIYKTERSNYENSTTYVNIESFAQLTNLYDDLDLIYNYEHYGSFKIEFNGNKLLPMWGTKDLLTDKNGTVGLNQLGNYIVLRRCTSTQIQRILVLKDLYTFSYRKDFGSVSYQYENNSPNEEKYTTFIFYPLNENGKDPKITNNELNNNKDYYETLLENDKLQVLSISSQLSNIMLNYITNIYKSSDGTGLALCQYIKDSYLIEGKNYNQELLDNDRDKIIGTTESNNFTKYNDKIRLAKSQLLLKNENNLNENEKNLLFSFYEEAAYDLQKTKEQNEKDMMLFRQKYLVNSNIQINGNEELLPKIISYDNSILQQLSDVITDEDTGEITITDGIFKKYLDQIGGEDSLLLNQEILKQAQALLKLYQQQYNNYSEKYKQYTKEAIEQEAIYNSYNNTSDGQEVLNYYNNNGKTLEQYRMNVKEAWWKFLNLLDDRYTEEKERGMYI